MVLLYHSDGCNIYETMFHRYYANDGCPTHAVGCRVTTDGIRAIALTLGLKPFKRRPVGWVVTIGAILS
jgi:hypothetical protein